MQHTTSYVGVKGWSHGDIDAELKRAALLFDRVLLAHVHRKDYCQRYPELRRTLEWLTETGVVTRVPGPVLEGRTYLWLHEDEDMLRSRDARPVLATGRPAMFVSGGPSVPRKPLGAIADAFARDLATQPASQAERRLAMIDRLRNLELEESTSTPVLRILFDRLPLPGKETPWEAIQDWRNDEEGKEKFALLRHWINRMDPAQPAHVLADELEATIAQYRQYMRVQHRRFPLLRWEAVVRGTVELLEALPRIRISPLIGVFHARERRLNLSAEELKAPGREVAYLVASEDRFR